MNLYTNELKKWYTLSAVCVTSAIYAQSNTFISMGPAPLVDPLYSPSNSPTLSSRETGEIRSIATSPTDPNTLFVTAPNGGIWKTTDLGQTWMSSSDHLPTLAVASIAFDPTDPSGNTLIAGTGACSSGYYNEGSIGVYYSTNGGISWSQPAGNSAFASQQTYSVLALGDILFAGTRGSGPVGLYRSTDRGNTFFNISNRLSAGWITSLATANQSEGEAVFATVSNGASSAIYKSLDSGDTWVPILQSSTPITGGSNQIAGAPGPVYIKVAATPSDTVGAMIIYTNSQGNKFAQICLSQDQGTTWTQLANANQIPIGGVDDVTSGFAIDPANPSTVYTSGSYNDYPFQARVFQCSLGENDIPTVVDFSLAMDNSKVHGDSHGLAVSGSNLFIVSDGGVAYIPTSRTTWSGIPGNIVASQIYQSAYEGNFNSVLAAFQDTSTGILRHNLAAEYPYLGLQNNGLGYYNYTGTGDGTQAVVDDSQTNLSIYYVSISGFSMTYQTPTSPPTGFVGISTPITLGNGLTRMVLNRVNPSYMAIAADAGGNDNRWMNLGTTTYSIPPVVLFAQQYLGSTLNNDNYTPLDYGTIDNQYAMILGNNNNYIYYCPNIMANPPTMTQIIAAHNGHQIGVFDYRTSQRFYLIENAGSGGVLYGTNNSGATLTNLMSNLPYTTPYALEFLSYNGVNALFVGGTSSNLNYSPIWVADSDVDGNLSNWRPFGGNSLPNAIIAPGSLSYNKKADVLFSGTFGRGAWVMYDATSNFPSATELWFGKANNNSTPDVSILAGNQPVIKYGTGTLTFPDTIFTGAVTVQGGTLALSNTTIINTVTVQSGATLTGYGILSNLTMQSGSTFVQDPEQQLVIANSFTFQPQTTWSMTISPQPTDNGVFVLNTLSGIGDTVLQVDQLAGTYPDSQNYPILTTAGTVPTPFSQIVGGMSGFIYSIVSDSNSQKWYLHIQKQQISLSGLTSNALSFATYLNNNAPDSTANEQIYSSGDVPEAVSMASPARNAGANFVAMNAMFAFSNVIGSHCLGTHSSYLFRSSFPSSETTWEEIPLNSFIASQDTLPYGSLEQAVRQKEKTDIWMQGVTDFSRQEAQSGIPTMHFVTQGLFLGIDRFILENGVVGGMIGYGSERFNYEKSFGDGSVDSFVTAAYGTSYFYDAYVETELVFAINQIKNKRNVAASNSVGTAVSSHRGYQLMPHLSLGYDVKIGAFEILEPFATVDWVVNWEKRYTESGNSQFNMKMQAAQNSMLRSEFGVRNYQNWQWDWGMVVLRETASYVNQTPFGVGRIIGTLVGTPGTFVVNSFTTGQNFFFLDLSAIVKASKGLYGVFSYSGEFGSGFITNNLQLKFGKLF